MTIDDDDTTTGGRAAGTDTIKIYRNGQSVAQFNVSRPMTWLEKLAIIRKVWSLS